MTKQVFLNQLQKSLGNELDQRTVQDNVTFYKEYIECEVKKGYRVDEVLTKLGDPRLIAKTIIEISDTSHNSTSHYQEVDSDKILNPEEKQSKKISNWLFKIIIIVLTVVLIGLIFTVLRVILPYLIVVVVAVGAVNFIKKWLG